MRFCLRQGVAYGEVQECLKETFVLEAADDMQRNENKVSVSRLSVTTGLNRREVTRIYKTGEKKDRGQGLPERILNRWEQSSRFCGKNGRPRVLGLDGPECEFNELVRSVSQDVGPKAVLFELERLGAVERTRNGVKLINAVSQHHKDPEEAYELLSTDMETLSRAVDENVFDTAEPRNHHIRTEYRNVYVEDIPRIREWLYTEGARFHRKARQFLSRFDKDLNPKPRKKAGARVSITSFSHTEKMQTFE